MNNDIPMAINTKRVYEPIIVGDGMRILVDRLWPRGLTKEQAGIDLWLRDIAPSTSLRRWYNHDPSKWDEFKRRYFKELEDHDTDINTIQQQALNGPVVLVFAAKEIRFNNAVALKDYIALR